MSERTGLTLGTKKILVLSAHRFSHIDLKDSDLIISIMSPGMEHPRPTPNHKRLDVQFHDITEEYMLENQNRVIRPIEQEQADLIVNFVKDNIEDRECLVIHCEAGISRSAGVAVGLCRYFDISNENEIRSQFPLFNLTVAKKIWKACQALGL